MQTFKIGQRVEVNPVTGQWMKCRTGTVVPYEGDINEWARQEGADTTPVYKVRLDTGRYFCAVAVDLQALLAE